MTADPPESLRFECDAMLVKLARYLRCLGYDATWDLEALLARHIDRADREGRIFLTRSRRLAHQQHLPERLVVLVHEDPVEQVRELVATVGLDPAARLFTRCIRCNVELEGLAKDEALRSRVPATTFASYERFFGCPSCGTVFWKGSHVRNTCRKLGLPDASE